MIDLSNLITSEDKAQKAYDQACDAARKERDELLDIALGYIQRYQLQTAGGFQPDDNEAVFQDLLAYAQELRDVPQQEGFPEDIQWPELPE